MSKNWKETRWNWTCINWKYYRGICLEEMRKNTKFSPILFSVVLEIRTTHFRNKKLVALPLQQVAM